MVVKASTNSSRKQRLLFKDDSIRVLNSTPLSHHDRSKEMRYRSTSGYERTDLFPLAEKRFKKFIAVISSLVRSEKIDLIISSGDAGMSSVEFTKMIYAELGKPAPETVIFPLFRERDSNGRTISVNINPHVRAAKKFLAGKKIRTVLYVDDEVGSGGTVRACMELLFTRRESLELPLTFIVVAEDHGLKPIARPGVNFVFRPFCKGTSGEKGIYSLTSRLITPEFEAQVRKIIYPRLDKSILWKYATNILLDLPVKVRSGKRFGWTYRYRDKVMRKMPALKTKQAHFRRYITTLIKKNS